jgi:hypothetical protein
VAHEPVQSFLEVRRGRLSLFFHRLVLFH